MSNSSCLDSSLDPLPLTFFLVSWLKFWWWVVEVEGGDGSPPRVLLSLPLSFSSLPSLYFLSLFLSRLKGAEMGLEKGKGAAPCCRVGGFFGEGRDLGKGVSGWER